MIEAVVVAKRGREGWEGVAVMTGKRENVRMGGAGQ